jgi:RNA-directed DNA polymerase
MKALNSREAAERVLASITCFLENKLLLENNSEKTSICRPSRFTLLGHGFVSSYKKGGWAIACSPIMNERSGA